MMGKVKVLILNKLNSILAFLLNSIFTLPIKIT